MLDSGRDPWEIVYRSFSARTTTLEEVTFVQVLGVDHFHQRPRIYLETNLTGVQRSLGRERKTRNVHGFNA